MEIQSITEAQQFNERRFTKIDIYRNQNSTLFILNFLPGQQMPAHYHKGFELYFHVIQGNGMFTIDGNDHEVTTDNVVHCRGDEKVSFTNISNEMTSVHVTLSRIGDGDITSC